MDLPTAGRGWGERRQGLTEKEKAREQATSAGAFLHAVSYWCRVSPPFAQRFPLGGEGAKGS